MTIVIHRETPAGPAWGEPTCDHCGATETRENVMAGHGILNMGWQRRPERKHLCPKCVADEPVAMQPCL